MGVVNVPPLPDVKVTFAPVVRISSAVTFAVITVVFPLSMFWGVAVAVISK